MSHLVIITPNMHKVAGLAINVRYRRPGNVVEYLPVEFEVFKEGEGYKAIPLQTFETALLTNLPKALLFQVKNGKIYNYTRGTQEIVEAIASEMEDINTCETAKMEDRQSNVQKLKFRSLTKSPPSNVVAKSVVDSMPICNAW